MDPAFSSPLQVAPHTSAQGAEQNKDEQRHRLFGAGTRRTTWGGKFFFVGRDTALLKDVRGFLVVIVDALRVRRWLQVWISLRAW